jgi:WD40 repeat protein
MSYRRQYVFEIDVEAGEVTRHWTGDPSLPIHINSDITISDTELIFCTGGSHTVVFLDLQSMTSVRIIDEHPGALDSLAWSRESMTTVTGTLMRANPVTDAYLYVSSLKVSRGALIDGIYACQLSPDQTLLFTANRGQNHITVYDYPRLSLRTRVHMPELSEIDPRVEPWRDPRLGFHHSALIGPAADATSPTGARADHTADSSGASHG